MTEKEMTVEQAVTTLREVVQGLVATNEISESEYRDAMHLTLNLLEWLHDLEGAGAITPMEEGSWQETL